jgi:hypothetical protein
MTTASDPGTDPITASLRQAIEHLELANRAIYGDRREVLDLYDIIGALTTLVGRVPQMIEYFRSIVSTADADLYDHDDGSSDPAETLNLAQSCLDTALTIAREGNQELVQAWSEIGHLRIHDTGTDPA